MHAAQQSSSKVNFVTPDKKSNISTLWQRKQFFRICSGKNLAAEEGTEIKCGNTRK